jgi:GNAT-family acetyltransferase (TIGR03103 family)
MSKTRKERDPRLDRTSAPSLRNWQQPRGPAKEQMATDAFVEMGWGKLIFGHTFSNLADVVELLLQERSQQRDIAFYLRDPHVIVSMAPDRLFLDPSHTYRLWRHQYRPGEPPPPSFTVRRMKTREDAQAVNRIYAARQMVTCDPDFMLDRYATRLRTYFVAELGESGRIVGTVTGVDHVEAFNDPEQGASLWCLAVDPQCQAPAVGQTLVRRLVEHYQARGRQYVDLSVMHDNSEAISLYEKLGFRRVPVFCVKRRNAINEPLFTPTQPQTKLNPYAKLIVKEAGRRGIVVNVIDADAGYFSLHMGGRTITCRESLSELTSAVAMSLCDDKRMTRKMFVDAGLSVPAQIPAGDPAEHEQFLTEHGRVVVKPARGEQGAGISVDLASMEEIEKAVELAQQHCDQVMLEAFVQGDDLRVIVINFEVVAAAVRKPPIITGTGRHSIEQIIDKYNRRRMAATGGESKVPMDDETLRCVRGAGYEMDDVLEADKRITVRRAANLHTGGTIHDVTDQLHPDIAKASVAAAKALNIPVTGLDFIIQSPDQPEHVIIEANERPGLANHEPQPTAERFIDLLFPQSRAR